MSLLSSIFFSKSGNDRLPPIPLDTGAEFKAAQKSVLIIGAGAAGLTAGNVLKKQGIEFKILEASDMFGGRIRRLDNFADLPFPLSLGAEWIHFPDPQIVQDMLVLDDINVLEAEEFIPFDPQELVFGKTHHNWIRHFYQETKFKQISWHVYLEKYFYRHVKEDVEFNKVVESIDYSGNMVKVTTKDGSKYHADKVICTIPLGVLKTTPPLFHPPLPAWKVQALESADMPPAVRLYMEMKKKFYPTVSSPNSLWKALNDNDDLCVMWDPLHNKELPDSMKNKAVVGFVAVGHKNAGPLSKLTEKELLEKALDIMDEMFDGKARQNFTGVYTTINWDTEPFARGSYTFPVTKDLCKQLGASVGDKGQVLFAGEHTDPLFTTYVHGAAREGRRAAVEAVSPMTEKPTKPCFSLF